MQFRSSSLVASAICPLSYLDGPRICSLKTLTKAAFLGILRVLFCLSHGETPFCRAGLKVCLHCNSSSSEKVWNSSKAKAWARHTQTFQMHESWFVICRKKGRFLRNLALNEIKRSDELDLLILRPALHLPVYALASPPSMMRETLKSHFQVVSLT